MRPTTLLGAGVALLAAAQPSLTAARGVHVNLTASWPSSPLFPLLETRYERSMAADKFEHVSFNNSFIIRLCSEFLAEENPLYFWQFLDELKSRASYVELKGGDVDAMGALAVAVAESIAPGSKNVRILFGVLIMTI
jgi:hypothetical protein